MQAEMKLAHQRLGVLQLAELPGNDSEACRRRAHAGTGGAAEDADGGIRADEGATARAHPKSRRVSTFGTKGGGSGLEVRYFALEVR